MDLRAAIKMALVHHGGGRLEEAKRGYQLILRHDPSNAEVLHQLGTVYYQLQDVEAAEAMIRRSIQLKPGTADYYTNLGNVFASQRKSNDAADAFRRATELSPHDHNSHLNLGTALLELYRYEEAIAVYLKAIDLSPGEPRCHAGLGNALRVKGDLGESVSSHKRALSMRADCEESLIGLGVTLQDMGRVDEALGCYERVLQRRPSCIDAKRNRALALLSLGHFKEGWDAYEERDSWTVGPKRTFDAPRWNGEDLNDRTILLHAEQGLGDTIQFIRYASLVANRGGHVIMECQPALTTILRSVVGIEGTVAAGDDLPPFDVHCPLLSLPRLFETSWDNIPNQVPYVKTDTLLTEHWNQRFAKLPGRKIGIVWSTDPTHEGAAFRSVPLTEFEQLARLPDVRLVSLQNGAGTEELHRIGLTFEVVDFGQDLDRSAPFLDRAAVMKCLDAFLTIDTAAAHLAGALGINTFMVIPTGPDWRWRSAGDTTDWYPTVRLLRQRKRWHWDDILKDLSNELA